MDYSPFNPVVWGLFAVFVMISWISVTLYHRKNPDYPNREFIDKFHYEQTREGETVKTDHSGS